MSNDLAPVQPWAPLLQEAYERRFGHQLTPRQLETLCAKAERIAHDALLPVAEYSVMLRTLPLSSPLVQALVAPTTNKETYFFRDGAATASLREHLIPALVDRKRLSRVLRIWSAGCSTGEEVYSIAILVQEAIPDASSWSIALVATDVDLNALAIAKRGEYRNWSLRATTASERARYFTQDTVSGVYLLHERFRKAVTFGVYNLADSTAPVPASGNFDLILCRNVAIYFSRPAQAQLAMRIRQALAPGGIWVSGSSDPVPASGYRTRVFPGLLLHEPSSDRDAGLAEAGPSAPPGRAPSSCSRLREVARAAPVVVERWPAPLSAGRIQSSPSSPPTEVHVPSATSGEHEPAILAQQQASVAQLLADRGELAQAREVIDRALRTAPTAPELHFVSALVHEAENSIVDALEALRRVLYLDRDHTEAHLRLGLLLARQGDVERAARSLHNAIEAATGDGEADALRFIATRQLARLRELRDD